MSSNPYQGFDSPFVPGYSQPYNQCGCGARDACGNEHQPVPKVETIVRATGSGKTETITRLAPQGVVKTALSTRAFSTWDGQLAQNDLHYKPSTGRRPYRPPALPYVCDRPLSGASLCSVQGVTQCSP